MTRVHSESGFSLIELLIATGLLLVVSSIVTGALMQMTTVADDDLESDRDAQRHPRRDGAAAAGSGAGRTRQRCRARVAPGVMMPGHRRDRAWTAGLRCDPGDAGAERGDGAGQLDGRNIRLNRAACVHAIDDHGRRRQGVRQGRSGRYRAPRPSTPVSTTTPQRRARYSCRLVVSRPASCRRPGWPTGRPQLCSSCTATSTATATWCTSSTRATPPSAQPVSERDGVRRRGQAGADGIADSAQQHHPQSR